MVVISLYLTLIYDTLKLKGTLQHQAENNLNVYICIKHHVTTLANQ